MESPADCSGTRRLRYLALANDARVGLALTRHADLGRTRLSVAAAHAFAVKSPYPVRVETILLVEDAGGKRKLAKQALERSGYRVIEAANASEALFLSDRHAGAIHLIVSANEDAGSADERLADQLNIRRPGLRRIRPMAKASIPLSPRTPTPFDARPAGCPFSPGLLLRAVKTALSTPARKGRHHHA